MDKKYIELFKELAHATEVLAEQVYDYDKQKNDEKGAETAALLRDDFQKLYDKMRDEAFDGKLEKAEYAKLMVGALIIANQLQERINGLKKALTGYQTDVIPKLQEIVEKSTSDEEAQKMADEKFIVEENK